MNTATSIDYKACAEAILAYHGFNPDCVPAKNGIINKVFISEQAVVRIPKDLPHNFYAEKFAMSLAREYGLPVPCVLAVDDSKAIAPVSYMLEERLPGSHPGALNPEIVIKMGAMLAKLHSLPVEGYGRLGAFGTGIHPTWKAYVARRQELSRTDFAKLNPRLAERCDSVYEDLAEQKVVPCFLHNDYHQGNLLFSNGEISGVLDFIPRSGSPFFEAGSLLLNLGECAMTDFEIGYGQKFDRRAMAPHMVDNCAGKLPFFAEKMPQRVIFLQEKLDVILKKLGK